MVVAHGTGLRSASDTGLQGETVYYYALFPFSENPTRFEDDPHNRAMAMATAPYDFAGRMYEPLPAIYRRFDAARLPALDSGWRARTWSGAPCAASWTCPGHSSTSSTAWPGRRSACST